MTELITYGTNPFEGPVADWHAQNESVGVTFQLIAHRLYECWFKQCVGFVPPEPGDIDDPTQFGVPGGKAKRVDHSAFDPADVREPGIHERVTDDHHHYDIIIPNKIMPRDLCKRWLQELNREYDRNLQLRDPPWPSEDS